MKKYFSHISGLFSYRVIIPAMIVLLASAGAFAMIKTAPKAHKRAPTAETPFVETKVFEKGTHRIQVSAMGTIVAAHKISLEARVSGNVISVSESFIPCGCFQKGEEILRIDRQDYDLALSEVKAEVTNAEYNLKIEHGYQNVAEHEWNLLKKSAKGTVKEAALALRKPHLEKAKADLTAAKAKVRKALLDLERTKITAPFAAMVETKSTDIGATVNSQEALATLVGTDEFWVQVSVPVDRLDWITFPSGDGTPGAKVDITSGSSDHTSQREGLVIRLLPSLESEGRMARVLVSVKDPLNLARNPNLKPMLLDSYVTVYIDGREIDDAYCIPREAFRENGKIWIMTAEGRLDVRQVNPVWRDAESVLIKEELRPGEEVIMSFLSTPVQGMKLRTIDSTIENTANKDGNS